MVFRQTETEAEARSRFFLRFTRGLGRGKRVRDSSGSRGASELGSAQSVESGPARHGMPVRHRAASTVVSRQGSVMSNSYLITGGAGFIGSHLAEALLE